jgi:hypothetical protein
MGEVNDRLSQDILQFVASIQVSCEHDPVPWQSASIDDRDGKRHYFTIMRCKKCGMNNPI